MKRIIFVLTIVLPLFAFTTQGVIFTSIINAFQAGDATTLSTFFDEKVEIDIMDEDKVYPRTEATQVMKTFFANYKSSSFTTQHEGTSPSGANYCIGILKTSKGSLRVSIHAKTVGGKKIVQQIQIEEE